jgi:hypothetical protein
MTHKNSLTMPDNLLANISHIIEQARAQVQRNVNSAMVVAYWQ